MGFYDQHVYPHLVDLACGGEATNDSRGRWVPRARGVVLEVGVGSGLNLRYYNPARVKGVLGVDPSAAMLDRARQRASEARVPVEFQQTTLDRLRHRIGTFDTAVITFTLCSLSDPAETLRDIRRLVRPGGELIFIEHGLAPDAAPRRWQHVLTPLWSRASAGCKLDRDVRAELRAAGFEIRELTEHYRPGPRWLTYTYEGLAVA